MKALIAGLLILVGGHLDDPNHAWFESLHNQRSVPCCDTADGHRVNDADWDIRDDGHYTVHINGQWLLVPDEAVINPKDRPADVGYAVVWYKTYDTEGKIITIWCFMPGSGV